MNYTKDDFLTGTAPYEWIEGASTPFEMEQRRTQMMEYAKEQGVKNFATLHNLYKKTQRLLSKKDYVENACNFEGQPMELSTGAWQADDYGIAKEGYQGVEEVACVHPIIPVLRLVNIDSGLEKIKLAFRPGSTWREAIFDRKTVASRSLIVDLANHGIAVDTENSRFLVKYLSDVLGANYGRIPEKKSVSRLGWVGNEGFSPYVDGLVFDGEDSFKAFFESVSTAGSEKAWMDLAKKVRAGDNPVPRILLAASFASVLIDKLGGLPFFVHMWGGTEAGKTVGLMLAASVWANPEMGRYIHTFNSTAVAQELSAAFVNSLPLCLDELQILKDKKDFDQMIYQLAEGVGKGRGEKSGGLRKVGTWRNCILTTGEQPITSSASGGGAINRIVEINCADLKLFEDPRTVADTVRLNFGHAGRKFVEILTDEVLEEAKAQYRRISEYLNTANEDDAENATEKQSMAAAMILVADWLAGKYIFKDKRSLGIDEIAPYLATKHDVDQNQRAYEWLLDWVSVHNSNFYDQDNNFPIGPCYGKEYMTYIAIIGSVFDDACKDAGFNPKSFLLWLRRNDKIITDGGRNRKNCRISGSFLTKCVCLKKA